MSKTLKQEAEEWAADFWDDEPNYTNFYTSSSDQSELSRSAGEIGYIVGYGRALASIETDESDLLGCCFDYAELESEGGGTQGLTLKDMLFEAYYQGAKLAVERIKEEKWVKK